MQLWDTIPKQQAVPEHVLSRYRSTYLASSQK